jgi:hypothetical protein
MKTKNILSLHAKALKILIALINGFGYQLMIICGIYSSILAVMQCSYQYSCFDQLVAKCCNGVCMLVASWWICWRAKINMRFIDCIAPGLTIIRAFLQRSISPIPKWMGRNLSLPK